MDSGIFPQLAIVLTFSSLLGFIAHKLKFPLIIAYLLTGVLISFGSFFNLKESGVLTFLPEIGVAFVLFLIGMELDLREIKNLGIPILVTGLGQIIISSIAGFAIAGALGFTQRESLYIGLGLSFSSTVVVIKLLLEKRDLTSLYGKLSLGILLLEDLVAILILMFLGIGGVALTNNGGVTPVLTLSIALLKATFLFLLTFILSKFVLENLFKAVAKSGELLFLTALTWCFVFTALAILLGFSVVIGAFLAGVALASSPYHLQIQGKIKPLRDFFLTLFFVYLGSQVKINHILSSIPAVLALSAYAILIKPIIFLLILGIFGFRKHTLFHAALNMSQISEFSLVILVVGLNLGLVSGTALSVVAFVGVVSIIVSSILIAYSKKIYTFAMPILPFFEHQTKIHILESKTTDDKQNHVILVGANKLGWPVVRFLKNSKIPFLVLDFNPHVIEKLRTDEIEAVYGDISDPDILEFAQISSAKLIISTARDLADNKILLEEARRKKIRAKVVVRAVEEEDAIQLKKLGADYVILPEKVSGEFIVEKLKTKWL